jgi:hypothetical protein
MPLAVATIFTASDPAVFFDPADPIDFLGLLQAKLLGETVVVAIDHEVFAGPPGRGHYQTVAL